MILRVSWAFLLLALGPCAASSGQGGSATVVKGVEVYGHDREDEFPIIFRDSVDREGKGVGQRGYITIQFDAIIDDPTGLKIRFLHCSRDWQPDDNLFVQDIHHNTSHYLEYAPSPNGVRGYAFRYVNRFPDPEGIVRFDYSGNWIFRIMDNEETTSFAEGRFFVVDQLLPARMSVANDYLTANVSPMNQVHRVDIHVQLQDETEGIYFTAVDVYQNRRFFSPFRIDVTDRDPYTFVDGLGRGYRVFSISDIFPGNEYRVLDLSDPNRYPNGQMVRSHEGADQPRLYWRTGPDRNGTAVLNRFTGIHSDYLDVLFRLDMTETDRRTATSGGRGIFLAGPFNEWEPLAEDQLHYDEQERSMTVTEGLRRGVYDYQYVTGIWDERRGIVKEQDWAALEGNDWRTTNTYLAVVYYNEPRLGGFDRIVGAAKVASKGTADIPSR